MYTPAPLLSLVVSAPTGTPTATPVPTHTPAPTPEPTPDGLLGGRFDGFSYTGQVITDSEYRSEHICIQVYHASDSTSYKGYIDYHVADLHLQDITLLKTGSAGPDPTYLFTKLDAFAGINATSDSPAMARASMVFPVPGGPYRRTPFGGFRPCAVNFFGFFR